MATLESLIWVSRVSGILRIQRTLQEHLATWHQRSCAGRTMASLSITLPWASLPTSACSVRDLTAARIERRSETTSCQSRSRSIRIRFQPAGLRRLPTLSTDLFRESLATDLEKKVLRCLKSIHGLLASIGRLFMPNVWRHPSFHPSPKITLMPSTQTVSGKMLTLNRCFNISQSWSDPAFKSFSRDTTMTRPCQTYQQRERDLRTLIKSQRKAMKLH